MPNIKSAKKRVIVTSVKNLQNRMIMSSLKTAIKKFDAATAKGDKAAAAAEMKNAIATIDKAVAKGLVHKNNAAHKKSRIALAYNAM